VLRVRISPRPPLYFENTSQTQYSSYFTDFYKNQDNINCPTFEQHFFNDLKNKYLYKRGKYYYFSKRINRKPIKISLKSSNLDYCRILRNKILKVLSMNQDTIVDETLQKLIDKRNHILNLQRQLNTQNSNRKLSREEKMKLQS